jgi:2-methylcitrate dehydratase
VQNRNDRPPTDAVIADLARYIDQYAVASPLAWQTAQHCLLDSLGCAFEALAHPDCTNLLGPTVAGTTVPHGARVPGTVHVLDPIAAAFDTAALIRWLDYNDAFYGHTVIHPSDCIGALLAAADWSSRTRLARREPPLFMRDVLATMVKAYEVMGALALENAFTTELKLDHVLLVKVGCAGAVTGLLGGTRCEIESAISNAFIDGHALTAFRRKPNAGTRKSWSAADAASRGVWLALLALKGEMGYPSALTAKSWGFYDVLAQGQAFRFQRPLGSYVMENVQFKVSYPAAFHAQTAAEAAIRLHGEVRARLGDIARIELWSHGYGLAILDRSGPLANVADRDHCLQYIAAVGLVHGRLLPTDYEDEVAADPRIDALRGKMAVHEDPRYTRDFTAPDKRSNANAIRVHFRDGTSTGRVEVEVPAGHPRRRREALPLLMTKFEQGVARVHASTRRERIVALCSDADRLAATPVHELMDLLAAA